MPPPVEWGAAPRSEACRDPYDRDLSGLVWELSTHNEAFRTRRAAHNVRFDNTGIKRFHHPVVGDLVLSFKTISVRRRRRDDGRLHCRARAPHHDALNLLAGWGRRWNRSEAADAVEGL